MTNTLIQTNRARAREALGNVCASCGVSHDTSPLTFDHRHWQEKPLAKKRNPTPRFFSRSWSSIEPELAEVYQLLCVPCHTLKTKKDCQEQGLRPPAQCGEPRCYAKGCRCALCQEAWKIHRLLSFPTPVDIPLQLIPADLCTAPASADPLYTVTPTLAFGEGCPDLAHVHLDSASKAAKRVLSGSRPMLVLPDEDLARAALERIGLSTEVIEDRIHFAKTGRILSAV